MLKSHHLMPDLFSEAYLQMAIRTAQREKEETASSKWGYRSSVMEETGTDHARQ